MLAVTVLLSACGTGADSFETLDSQEVSRADVSGQTVTLITHGSFAVSPGIFDSFTAETGIKVKVESAGDAGEIVSAAILTAGNPQGDVMFGIDNTFLQRGLDANLFIAYASPGLADVPDDLELDDMHRVTPIDVGDVCVNYNIGAVPGGTPPTSLDDLRKPEFAASFVTMNPESSSPGFAFLLATIARYGEDGWKDYWQDLADGGIAISAGWEDGYYGEFTSGGGPRAIVTSYATSPVAEVLFADPPTDRSPTAVLVDSCFRQIEFAGILAGADRPQAAARLIDFLLGETFQADIPLNMFVAPVNQNVLLPDLFKDHGVDVPAPLTLSPEEIERGRSQWTDEWAEIVLR